MRSAAQTYKNVARQTSSPRELEATLLLQAAARLQSVHDAWDMNKGQLDEALLYNRRLWSVFLTEVTDAKNPMPRDVRQNVANIGYYNEYGSDKNLFGASFNTKAGPVAVGGELSYRPRDSVAAL